jgi:hypothetical protein
VSNGENRGWGSITGPSLPLVGVSFLSLFYELVFIRWLPANITSMAYFSNLVLISSFFGLGLGFLIPRKKTDLFGFFPPTLLLVVVVFVLLRSMRVTIPANSEGWIWSSADMHINPSPVFRIGIIPTLLLVFGLISTLFVLPGQKMCELMKSTEPLKAYTLNIIGSILGIAAFSFFSRYYEHLFLPLGWFVLGGGVTVLFFVGERRKRAVAIASTLILWIVIWSGSIGEIWSPYYMIQIVPHEEGRRLEICVNEFFHQSMIDFDVNAGSILKYGIPYQMNIPRNLLILGAGSGNDVAVARMHGVRNIDAVEIDPEIFRLGRTLHPQQPYLDPNVTMYVDDARSFLKKGRSKYEMIILGTLDSHALLSGMSTLRLDNFVYTKESMEDIRERLDDRGIVVLMFSVPEAWLGKKLVEMCSTVFKDNCYQANIQDNFLFNLMVIAGPGARERIDKIPGASGFFKRVENMAVIPKGLPTDDWPFLYLRGPQPPSYYLMTIVLLALGSGIAIFLLTPAGSRKPDPVFFSLGCAFLLLEARSVSALSLLFGSTWVVNASVFLAILLMILLANITVLKMSRIRISLVYLLLFASVLVNYFFPISLFLKQPFVIKSLVPALVLALPVYFGGIVFAVQFRETRNTGRAYGSNLLGCVFGGLLENASMIFGLKFLFLLAGGFYLVSAISRGRQ